MNKEKPSVKESVTIEPTAADASFSHHVKRMAAEAKASKKAQKFVLSSGKHDEGVGEMVLTVKPDGSHSVDFVKGE